MAAALFTVSSLRDFEVYDRDGAKLGTLVDVVLAMVEARVRYAVLAYEDERGAEHDKLLAVPLTSLRLDTENDCFILGVERGVLASLPGFDIGSPPAEPPAELAAFRPESGAALFPG
jgi:sporulation protein YlmC with PRC-barrel domain